MSGFVFVTLQLKFKSSQQFQSSWVLPKEKNQRYNFIWLSPSVPLSPAHLGYRSNDIQHFCTSVMVAGTWAWLCPKSAASISPRHDGWLHVRLCHRLHRRLPVPGGHPQCHPNTTFCKFHICVIVWPGPSFSGILYLNLLSRDMEIALIMLTSVILNGTWHLFPVGIQTHFSRTS